MKPTLKSRLLLLCIFLAISSGIFAQKDQIFLPLGLDGIQRSNRGIGIGTDNPLDNIHLKGNVFFEMNEGGSILLIDSVQNIKMQLRAGFQIRNSGVLTLSSNGYLGIGINDPTSQLDINGTIRIRGGLPGTGKILTSDANGYAIWQDPPNGSNWTLSGSNIYRSTGYVGIGTTSPSRILHLRGTSGNACTFMVERTSTTPSALAIIPESNLVTIQAQASAASTSARPLRFRTGTNEAMRITTEGNVGIGTTNPTLKLEVAGGDILVSNNILIGNSNKKFIFHTQYWNPNCDRLSIAPYNNDNWDFANGIALLDNGTLHVKQSLGIGTDNTHSYKLAVNGKILSEEVVVKLYENWPDYVFLPDYNLRTLEEVEAHISNHGHLPDVPNAQTVEANGIGVGEMNTILLKKIEELTLYMIKQNKRIEALEEENRKLNSK